MPPRSKFTSQEIAIMLDLVYSEREQLIEHVRANDPYPAELLSAANSKLHTLDSICSKLATLYPVSA